MKNGLKTFDSDMHIYDPADLYVKYMNPKWGERILRGQRNGETAGTTAGTNDSPVVL